MCPSPLSWDFPLSPTKRWKTFSCPLILAGHGTSIDGRMLTDDTQGRFLWEVLTFFHLCSYTFVTIMRTWPRWPAGRWTLHDPVTSVPQPTINHISDMCIIPAETRSTTQASSALITSLQTGGLTKSDCCKSLCFGIVGYAVLLWQ